MVVVAVVVVVVMMMIVMVMMVVVGMSKGMYHSHEIRPQVFVLLIVCLITFPCLIQGIFDTMADEQWKKQRKFAHTTLRGMGFGKVTLEPLIKDEVNHTIAYLKVRYEPIT